MIGSTVDKYEVLQKVGEGGMATVYRGRHTTLDRDVAIKVLHPHLSSSTRNRKRFAREARAIEHLRHANILEIFDYSGIDSGECYIITEFVEGDTLTAHAEEAGPLPSELVAFIGIKLCRALGYAHDCGILHRDLKPDNVMIRNDGTVKLMDFGIARFLDESQVTLTGALVGSPAFMSPEQAVEGELGLRSDLFSLGTVLFYLVSGELPFSGSNPSVILKKVIEGDRPNLSELVPTVSPTLADVVERLMSTSPDGRFNTASEVAEALTASLEEVGISLEDPAWALTAWLEEKEAYQRRLAEHVSIAMLDVGKQKLAEGDHLTALRLFNRLLALDDSNEEVLELIQGLHVEPARERSRALPFGLGLAALGLLIAGAIAVFALPTPRDDPDPVDTQVVPGPVVTPPTPQPVVPPAPETPALVEEPTPSPQPAPPLPTPSPAPVPNPAPIALPPSPEPLPRMPEPDVEAASETPQGHAKLMLRTNVPANVFREGVRLGSTRKPIDLPPGSHVLEIKSDVVQPYELKLEVSAGEERILDIILHTKPATVSLGPSVQPECEVTLDGVALGTAADLGGTVTVQNPEKPGHSLSVLCNGETRTHVWDGVVTTSRAVDPR